LLLVRHLTPRLAGKLPAACPGSERIVIRTKGSWKLEKVR
jgi:hypothetical protein